MQVFRSTAESHPLLSNLADSKKYKLLKIADVSFKVEKNIADKSSAQ